MGALTTLRPPAQGTQMDGTVPGSTGSTVPTSIPGTPGTALNPVYAAQNNPAAAPGSVPGGLGVTGGVTPGQGINWANQNDSVTGDFTQTYGQGTGSAITGVLQNLGTSNDAAIQATINAANQNAAKQFANIQAGEAASGVTPQSSTAALAEGDFYSTVQTNLNNTIAGMENQQETTLLDTLLQEGQAHGSDTSGWDTLGNVLSGGLLDSIGSVAGGISESTGAGGSLGTILDAIGEL